MDPKFKILLVDDEPNILKALERILRRKGYEVVTATSGHQGLEELKKGDFAVVVSDFRMPEMDGAQFLSQAREAYPLVPRIILTGYADMQGAMRTINEAQVSHYLLKPWDDQALLDTVESCAQIYQTRADNIRLRADLEQKNNELQSLNQSLEERVAARTQEVEQLNAKLALAFLESVRLMDKLAQMRNGKQGSQARRMAKLAKRLGVQLKMKPKELFQLEVAALLHDIGKMAIPENVLNIEEDKMSESAKSTFRTHATIGEKLVSEIPSMEEAALFIKHHHEYYNGSGYPSRLNGEDIPFGARILGLLDAYDKIVYSSEKFSSANELQAVDYIKANSSILFDPKLVEEFLKLLDVDTDSEIEISINEMRIGMQLSRDVLSLDGKVISKKGTVLIPSLIEKLHNWLEAIPGKPTIHIARPKPKNNRAA